MRLAGVLLILFQGTMVAANGEDAAPLVAYDSQVSFRLRYDGDASWAIIAQCIENATAAKAIIDRHGPEVNAPPPTRYGLTVVVLPELTT